MRQWSLICLRKKKYYISSCDGAEWGKKKICSFLTTYNPPLGGSLFGVHSQPNNNPLTHKFGWLKCTDLDVGTVLSRSTHLDSDVSIKDVTGV